jgi:hypothetical protein
MAHSIHSYKLKAVTPDGKVIWSGSQPKRDEFGRHIGFNAKVIDRGIKEAIGYSGKYKLEVE